MKRFLLFSAMNYESAGGWLDFVSDHDTLEAATAAGIDAVRDKADNWWHVVDTETGEIVRSDS